MSETLRCLSVRQPWAWALVMGAKDIENRSWTTDYRGPVVIHASSNKTVVNDIVRSAREVLPQPPFTFSAFIGVVDVLDIVPLSEDLESNPWAWGTYCWRVGNARRFLEPIPAKGKLNLYALPTEFSDRVQSAIAAAEVGVRDAAADAWINAMIHLVDEEGRHEGLFENYMELGDDKNALRLAERAVFRWGNADAFLDRAEAKGVDDLDGGLADINKALALDPSNARGFFLRSLVHKALNMHELAEQDRATAIELEPAYVDVPDDNEPVDETE